MLDAAFRGRLAGTTVGRWQTRQLSALLADLRYGTATKCGRLGAVPVLRIPNVPAGRVNLSDLKYADFDKQEVMRLSLEEGDLLIVRSNGSISLVGQCAVVPRAAEGMLFAGYLIRLRVDRNEVDPEFLHLMLSSPFSRGVIEGQAKSTSGVNNINGKQIEALVVPCPPIHDQKTTVRKATALMQRIERLAAEALKASTLLDQLDQATLSKAFVANWSRRTWTTNQRTFYSTVFAASERRMEPRSGGAARRARVRRTEAWRALRPSGAYTAARTTADKRRGRRRRGSSPRGARRPAGPQDASDVPPRMASRAAAMRTAAGERLIE